MSVFIYMSLFACTLGLVPIQTIYLKRCLLAPTTKYMSVGHITNNLSKYVCHTLIMVIKLLLGLCNQLFWSLVITIL